MPTFSSHSSPYPLAHIADGIERRGWTLDPARSALLVHDVLPYYVDTLAPEVAGALDDGVGAVLDWAADHDVPVLCSAPQPATRIAERGLGGRLWGLGPNPDEASDASLLHGITPRWVRKRSYSAFFATDLATQLHRTGRDQLVIVGVFASAGIVATAFDALASDVEAFVVADATADHSREAHVDALRYMARTMAEVTTLVKLAASGA